MSKIKTIVRSNKAVGYSIAIKYNLTKAETSERLAWKNDPCVMRALKELVTKRDTNPAPMATFLTACHHGPTSSRKEYSPKERAFLFAGLSQYLSGLDMQNEAEVKRLMRGFEENPTEPAATAAATPNQNRGNSSKTRTRATGGVVRVPYVCGEF
ncbi:hypothetical protein BDR26DRAFT_895625 [Obelidium mucronatum]|nr:hypothetical protein BDR26DRAFT_895625 [Obelidium mucronatum]